MIKNFFARSITIILLISLMISHASLLTPSAGVQDVHAAAPNINVITGLFRSIAALNKRNQVYAEARATAAEINAYYDAQIATAQRLRQEQIAAAISGGKNPQIVRSYIRVDAALEQERRAMIQMIEAEKNRARQEFNRSLANEIKNVLFASPGGQSILTDIRSTIKNTRAAAAALQAAANANSPTELLTEALTNRIGDNQIKRELAATLGSQLGNKIDRALGGAITRLEHAITDIKNELGQAINVLDDLEASVAQQQEQVRSPVSAVGNSTMASNFNPINPNSVGLDVASFAYTIATERSGNLRPGETRQSMYDQIRTTLQNAILTNTMNTLLGDQVGEIYCLVVSLADYQQAATTLGIDTQEPQNPEEARYLVCYDVATNEPKVARLLESKFTAETTEEESEETPTVETGDISGCLVDPSDYSYGHAEIKENNCTDPARCTGCVGKFVIQNDSDQVIHFYHYYYQNFSTPNFDDWKTGHYPIKPGEQWEEHESIDNRWKQGIMYRSGVVKILLIRNSPECRSFSEAQLNAYAITIEPFSCE